MDKATPAGLSDRGFIYVILVSFGLPFVPTVIAMKLKSRLTRQQPPNSDINQFSRSRYFVNVGATTGGAFGVYCLLVCSFYEVYYNVFINR